MMYPEKLFWCSGVEMRSIRKDQYSMMQNQNPNDIVRFRDDKENSKNAKEYRS